MRDSTRRSFLRGVGVTAIAGVAGCAGGEGNGDETDVPTVSGGEYPAIDEWLTETEIGGAASNYDGAVVDWRDRETVTVDVGAEGNSGHFAFGPAAVLVSTGTTVEWSWTGEGDPHNVEAEPDAQLGKSDYTFSSGDPITATGVQYSKTMDKAGIALYHCEPHLSLGMKGGIAVE